MRELLHSCFRNPISFLGAALASVSATLFFTLLGIEAVGFASGTYLGIITFLILPVGLVAGLMLVPLGLLRERKRHKQAEAAGEAPPPAFPVFDLNKPGLRTAALVVTGLTAINAIILSVGTYKGVQVMHSPEFCGGACHTVMSPEYLAYQRSPHASIDCTECHVGSGAVHFAKSKLNGAAQLLAMVTGRYERPIRTPVAHMRPADETCTTCHARKHFVPEKLRILKTYADDEANTEKSTVMMLKVGGFADGRWQGIHWHREQEGRLRYLGDERRQTIHTVELTKPDGTVKVFKSPSASQAPASGQEKWRNMDCLDCHNRPTHIFHKPEDEVNAAMARGRISRELPFVRREAVAALKLPHASHEEAKQRMGQALRDFFAKEYPDVAKEHAEKIDAAVEELAFIYKSNVSPAMNITWGTYPDYRGHDGCFRCHDNEHVTESGEKISKKCATCHEVLATDEEDPEVLQVLFP